MFPSPTKEYGYYREWYENSREVEFEGHFFQGMQASEDYLTFTYGDYMQLPPAEKRKVHPVSEIRLIEMG